MKKSKRYNLLLGIIGLVFAKLWRYILKGVNIPEFFKWFAGIVIIILIFFIIDNVMSLVKKRQENI